MADTPKVLIVGAGPSGLVAALTLLQNGVPVRIIDRAPKFHIGQRGAGITPRTLEVYEFLGVLPDILKAGFILPMIRSYEVGTLKILKEFYMSPFIDPEPAFPYLNSLTLGQNSAEHILRTHLAAKYGCGVDRGTELRSFTQDDSRVTAQIVKTLDGGEEICEEVVVDWLIGTDGARGTVRKQLGLAFLGDTRHNEHFLVADIRLEGLDRERWHMWGDFSSEMVGLRPTENGDIFWLLGATAHGQHEKLASDPKEMEKWMRQIADLSNVKIHEFITLNHFNPNIRMVDKFGDGRVFVAGDAAHVHTPFGGQGMNSSVMDSFNLAWKLALVCKGLSAPSLLTTYTEERLPVIAEMLKKTTSLQNRMVQSKRTASSLLSNGSNVKPTNQTPDGATEENPWIRGRVLTQLGVNYRWSPIVLDERFLSNGKRDALQGAYGDSNEKAKSSGLRPGDRGPDAPGLLDLRATPHSATTRLFQLFRPYYHTILIFASTPEVVSSTRGVCQRYASDIVRLTLVLPSRMLLDRCNLDGDCDFLLKDCFGYAYAAYSVPEGGRIVIVRPDGIVGAIVNGTEGVERYLQAIFI
ncbi:hypothetical protein JAAARDRAFT_74621 [Jaapia argillacea MUCL 33604]|uniref:FAD-binding domain-containing protein n=1 Tax=Jaapia argillacea MUCL 33604 TaxID=933084 RepID=A0A067P3U9_9AGAM|nr:hypothetical protein JAAARDRAFT_74621 [Jaapia argillacea MUCL 33604]